MATNLHCPQPVRSFKRSLQSINPDYLPVSKHPRLALLPSVGYYHSPHVLHSSSISRSKSFSSSVRQWLSQVPRTRTAPPRLVIIETSEPVVTSIVRCSSALGRIQMSQPNRQRPGSTTSTGNARPSTSDPMYRSLIYRNHIILDPSGKEIEEEIKELLDTQILKERDSPPLTAAEVFDVVDMAVDLLDSAEGKVSDLLETKPFPMRRRGIVEGRNVQWSTDALPSNPKYPHQLSAPKPDRHYGYPLGHKSEWTDEEMAVVDHRTAQPYTQPTRENLFPFLMLEIKSEATGGVLYVAENQAVGSGVHSVGSLRWLLAQAFPSEVRPPTDCVSFTGAITPRLAIFYIVWYSERKQMFIMSKIKTISFMDGPERPDIQSCKNIMNNIFDYGLGFRQKLIREALEKLDPVPPGWKKSRAASAIT